MHAAPLREDLKVLSEDFLPLCHRLRVLNLKGNPIGDQAWELNLSISLSLSLSTYIYIYIHLYIYIYIYTHI